MPGGRKRVYTESSLFDLPYPHRVTRYNAGGVPFYYLYKDLPTFNLQRMLSNVGIGLTFSISLLVSFLLATEIKLIPLILSIKKKGSSAHESLSRPLSE